jgi:hypothetical protein
LSYARNGLIGHNTQLSIPDRDPPSGARARRHGRVGPSAGLGWVGTPVPDGRAYAGV